LAVVHRAAHGGVEAEALHDGAKNLMELRIPWHRAVCTFNTFWPAGSTIGNVARTRRRLHARINP
jgi:hypothetical protein